MLFIIISELEIIEYLRSENQGALTGATVVSFSFKRSSTDRIFTSKETLKLKIDLVVAIDFGSYFYGRQTDLFLFALNLDKFQYFIPFTQIYK